MQQWYQTERLAVDNLIRGQQKNSPAIQKTKQQLSLHSFLAWLFSYLLKWFRCNINIMQSRLFSCILKLEMCNHSFYSQPGEGHSFFGKEKITPYRFYFVYTSKATSQD